MLAWSIGRRRLKYERYFECCCTYQLSGLTPDGDLDIPGAQAVVVPAAVAVVVRTYICSYQVCPNTYLPVTLDS